MRRNKIELEKEDKEFKIQKDENGLWIGFRICPCCNKEVRYSIKIDKVFLLRRNIRNANSKNILCLSCSTSGVNNPFYNKKHSEKSKIQCSKSRTGKGIGENNAMANPEHRKKVSDALIKMYASGALDFLKEIQSITMKKTISDGRLINNLYISKQEMKLQNELENIFGDEKIIIQHKINTLSYDFYIPEKNLLIEYNGNYWHCNPEKYSADYFNKKKNMTAQELWDRDEIKKQLAINSGYNFITIWENDFIKNKKETLEKIINHGK